METIVGFSHPSEVTKSRYSGYRIELTSATQELNGLLALEYQMARNLEALRQQQAEIKFSRTVRGKLFNLGGRLFAVYCVYRIVVVSLAS